MTARITTVATALVLHAGVLLVPSLLLGTIEARSFMVLIGATALFIADLPAGLQAGLHDEELEVCEPAVMLRFARVVGGLLLAAFWASTIWFDPAAGEGMSVLGLGMMFGGAGLRFIAIKTLGPAFATELVVVRGRSRVRHGIYAHLSHPSELGLVLSALGPAVIFGSAPAAAIVMLGIVPLVLWRITLEEAFLERLGKM